VQARLYSHSSNLVSSQEALHRQHDLLKEGEQLLHIALFFLSTLVKWNTLILRTEKLVVVVITHVI